MDFPHLETGGDFFGFWSRSGWPIVQFALGPGPNVRRTGHSFYQDIEYLKHCGSLLNSKYGLEHIGAWHSHHQLGLTNPSSGDVATMKNALRSHNLARFLISICSIKGSSVEVNGFLFRRDDGQDYVPCAWEVMDRASPIRQSVGDALGKVLTTHVTDGAPAIFTIDPSPQDVVQDHSKKAEFAAGSYWGTPEGRGYLKNVYEKLRQRDEVSNVEILQRDGERIALSFVHDGQSFEIRFPADFPKGHPEVVETDEDASFVPVFVKKVFRPRPRVHGVRSLIQSLGILGEGTLLIVRRS
jgi:hypothetical protein